MRIEFKWHREANQRCGLLNALGNPGSMGLNQKGGTERGKPCGTLSSGDVLSLKTLGTWRSSYSTGWRLFSDAMYRFRCWWRRGTNACHGTLASPFESLSSGGILRCPEFGACGSGARKMRSRVARARWFR